MKTLVITIDDLVHGEYPVSVYFDDGAADWRSSVKAQGTISAGLVAFPAQNGAGPLAPDAIVDFLLQRESSPAFQKIGQHFWSLLHGSAIGAYLEDVWRTHVTNGNDMKAGVRTMLDVRPTALRRLPWELLFRNDLPLFASPLNPMVRGSLVPNAAPVATGFLLRVLVIVGSEPGDPAVKAEDEIAYLEDSVRGFRREVDLRVERPTSRNDFVRIYGEFMPHVLHFTGHGDQVPRANGTVVSSLVFSDGNGGRWDWLASEIQATLAVGAPRLAFLNACRTGTAAAREIVGTLSDAFLGAGALGVIAMQADITGEAAAEFAGQTYGALAKGQLLDVALANARHTVRERDGRTEYRDWCLPSLTLAVDVGDVLPSRLQLPQDQRDVLETTPEFVKIQAFVDRRSQRRSVDPLAARTPDEDVLVVSGPRSTGKTDMLLWFLEGCAWCGHRIKYVDLKRGRPGFLEVLEWIQRGETNPFSNLRQALAGDFGRVRQLTDVVRSGQPTAAPTPDDPIDSLFSAFRTALTTSAKGAPLIIALDHLGSMDPDAFRNYLRPYLLDHVVQRRMRPVRFVLCCTDDEYREFGLATLQPAHKVEVGPFPAKEFVPLYREYLLLKNVARTKIPLWPIEQKIDFLPQTLSNVYQLLIQSGQLP